MEKLLEQIDWSRISPYLIILLVVIWLKWDDLKAAITGLHTGKLENAADRREHQQWLDSQALEILREMLAWARDDFSELQHRIENLQLSLHRNNDLLTLHNQMTSKLIDDVQQIKRLYDKIDNQLQKLVDRQENHQI